MSQAKRPFPSIRAISRPISTSPFSEDVSGETPIFDIKRLKTKLSRSHFLEDVSGEIAVLGGRLPRGSRDDFQRKSASIGTDPRGAVGERGKRKIYRWKNDGGRTERGRAPNRQGKPRWPPKKSATIGTDPRRSRTPDGKPRRPPDYPGKAEMASKERLQR